MKNSKKIIHTLVISLCLGVACTMTAFAAGPVEALNSFTNILLEIIRIIAFIAIVFGLAYALFGLKGHDASQRDQGLLAFGVGLIFFFLPEILSAIGISL